MNNLPSKKKVLIVDDDEPILKTLKPLLERRGFEVSTAVCGATAKAQLNASHFDALLLDIYMPGDLNGIELCQFVKLSVDVPIVMMTGFASMAEIEAAKKVGADAFLMKPFKLQELETVLERLFPIK